MNKRKKTHKLPHDLSNDIGETVILATSNMGSLNYKLVPLDIIEFDPENPRQLAIGREDLSDWPNKEDMSFEKKSIEYESLLQFSETIKKYGVRSPVEVYKAGAYYRLVHGERRCLASILAGKNEIPAKILNEKPSDLDIRILQLIENIQREDLNLSEVLNNIRQIIKEYKLNSKSPEKITSASLMNLINRSKSQVVNMLAIINGPKKLQKEIDNGKITSLEKSAIIAKAKNIRKQEHLLNICLSGATLKQLQNDVAQQKKVIQQEVAKKRQIPIVQAKKKKPGKKSSKITLGSTSNRAVIKTIINLVASDKRYSKHNHQLKELTLDDFDSCKHAFSKLISIMEKIEDSRN